MSVPTPAIAYQYVPPIVDPENQELIKRGRIASSEALISCYQTLFTEDEVSSRKRALAQAQADGEAPYSQDRERRLGTDGRANINWLMMQDALFEAEQPINTLLESLDTFGSTPTTYGDEQSRRRWSLIIEKEVARMIRKWPGFQAAWTQNNHICTMDGVSFAFFEDQIDWRWKVTGLQFFKFPRRTRADIEALDIVTCKVEEQPFELWRKIEAESELPEDQQRYWNREAVLQAIRNAAPQGIDSSNWEELQRSWKDNDLSYGITATTVPLVHGFIRELDGTVSHYIAQYNPAQGNEHSDFLYKCEGKYHSMSSLISPYLYDVGTNGDWHSIRGLAYRLYSVCTGLNRMRNKLLDAACHSATPYLSSSSEDAITDRSLQPFGPMVILNDKAQFSESPQLNLANNLIPALDSIERSFASKAASYSPVAAGPMQRTQKTKYQVQMEAETGMALSAGRFGLYMSGWEAHYKNIVRRVTNPNYLSTDPGGKEVWEMRTRCVALGVPLQAIYDVDIDAIEVNRGVGKGSASERRATFDTLRERVYPFLDQEGRRTLDYLTVAAWGGSSLANQLVPEQPGLRPPMDAQIALMENNLMALGQPPAFEVNQDHVVHVEKHLERLYQINTRLEQDPVNVSLEDTVNEMQPIWEHCNNGHMPLIAPENPQHGDFKQDLQQLGEFITNSRKHLDAEAAREVRDAEAEAMKGPVPAATGEVPAGLFRSAVDAGARASLPNQVIIQQEQQRLEAEQVKARQEAVGRDLENATKAVRLKGEMNRVKTPPRKS